MLPDDVLDLGDLDPQPSTSEPREEGHVENLFEADEDLFVLPTEATAEEEQFGEKKLIAVKAKFSMYPVKKHKVQKCIVVLHTSLFEIHDVPKKKKDLEEIERNGGRGHRYLILYRDIFNVCITDEMGGQKCTCISIMTVDHTFYLQLTNPNDNIQHFYTTLFERTRESRSLALHRPVYKEEFFAIGWDVILVPTPKFFMIPTPETLRGDFVTQNPWAAGHRRFVIRGSVFAFFVKDARPQKNVMSPWKAEDYFDVPSNNIAAMGCQDRYFLLHLGHGSEFGSVSLWLKCESVQMARAMQSAADQKAQRDAGAKRDTEGQDGRSRNHRNMERRARSEHEQQQQLKCQEEEEEKRMAKIMEARAAVELAEKIARGEIEPEPEKTPEKKRSVIGKIFSRDSDADRSKSPGAEGSTKKFSVFHLPFRASFSGSKEGAKPTMEQIKMRAEIEARERAEELARLEEEDRQIREEQRKEREAAAAEEAGKTQKPKKKKKTKKQRLKGDSAIRRREFPWVHPECLEMEAERRMEEDSRPLTPGEGIQLPRQYASMKSPPTEVEFGGGIMYPLDERQLPYNADESSRRHQSMSSKSALSNSASRDGRANSLGSRSATANRRLAASTTASSGAGRNVSASGSANTVVSTSIAEEDESAGELPAGISQKLALQPDIAVKPMPNDNRTRAHSWGSRTWLSNRLGNKRNSDAQAVPPSPRSHLLPSSSSELLVPERKRAESFGSAAPPRRPLRSLYGATVAVDSNEFVEFDFENSSKTGSPLDRSRHSSLGVQLPESVQTARESARARAKGEKFQPRNVCNRTIMEEPSPSRLTTSISAQPITTIVEERDDDPTVFQLAPRSPSVSSYESDDSLPKRPKKILYDWEEYDPNNPEEIPDIIFRPASKSFTSGPFRMLSEYEERTVYHRPKHETYVEGPWIKREPQAIAKVVDAFNWTPQMRPMSASVSTGRRRVAFDSAPQTMGSDSGKKHRRHKRRCHRDLTDEAEREARLQRHRERLQQRQLNESMEHRTQSTASSLTTPRAREVTHSMESGRSLDSARPRISEKSFESRRMESQDSVETPKSQRSVDTQRSEGHRFSTQKSIDSQRTADSPRQTPDSGDRHRRHPTADERKPQRIAAIRERLLENYAETEEKVARLNEETKLSEAKLLAVSPNVAALREMAARRKEQREAERRRAEAEAQAKAEEEERRRAEELERQRRELEALLMKQVEEELLRRHSEEAQHHNSKLTRLRELLTQPVAESPTPGGDSKSHRQSPNAETQKSIKQNQKRETKRKPIEKQRELDDDPTPKSSPKKVPNNDSPSQPKKPPSERRPEIAGNQKKSRQNTKPNQRPPKNVAEAAAEDSAPRRPAAVSPVEALKKSSALPSGDSPLSWGSESGSESDASTIRRTVASQNGSDNDAKNDGRRPTMSFEFPIPKAKDSIIGGGKKKKSIKSPPPIPLEEPIAEEPETDEEAESRERRPTLVAAKKPSPAKKPKPTVNFEDAATRSPSMSPAKRRVIAAAADEKFHIALEDRNRTLTTQSLPAGDPGAQKEESDRHFTVPPPTAIELQSVPPVEMTFTREIVDKIANDVGQERSQIRRDRRELGRIAAEDPDCLDEMALRLFDDGQERESELRTEHSRLNLIDDWSLHCKTDTKLAALFLANESEKIPLDPSRAASPSSTDTSGTLVAEIQIPAGEAPSVEAAEPFRKYSSAERQAVAMLSSRSGLAGLPQCFWQQPPQRKNAYGQPSPQGQRKASRRNPDAEEAMRQYERGGRPLITAMPSTFNPADQRTVQQKLAALMKRQNVDYMELLIPGTNHDLPDSRHPTLTQKLFDKPRHAVNATS